MDRTSSDRDILNSNLGPGDDDDDDGGVIYDCLRYRESF